MTKEESKLVSKLSDPKTRRETFAEVVRLYSERMYWQIRRIVLSHDDADDVLQNTFKVHHKFPLGSIASL